MEEKKYQGENVAGPSHTSPYPLDRHAPKIDLVALASEVALADDILTAQATGKLKLLAEQIRTLQEKARTILADTKRNQELHRAQCNFKKIVGKSYHLYRKTENTLIFSMIGPDEWQRSTNASTRQPYDYLGSYRLEPDRSWTELSGPDHRSDQ
ncbi:MAG: DUF2452 domain-containing protein [Desulfobulbaceae bacterium]|nr:MAG: DUF2452 domain-containing protein [Desulfobulbaceae bacterium]